MPSEPFFSKPIVVGPLLSLLLLALALAAGCKHGDDKEKESAKETHEEKAPESHVKHGTNGEVLITLEADVQKTMGLQTAPLEPARLAPELKAYGRVLDASPLASLVADLISAQAASTASQAEFDRLKNLAAQNNASTRAVEAATAAAAHDRAQVQSMRLRVLANWGNPLAQRDDLPALVQSLGSLESALVQLDLPAGETLKALPTGARLVPVSDETQTVAAKFLGQAPTVDPQMQGRGFLFLVQPNPARLAPGAAVTGYLNLPGEEQSGVAMPRDAVLHYKGTTWVYHQRTDTTFERREVNLDSPLAHGWFVREGFKPEDKVVTVGAQQLLSEELKSQTAE
jgi:hypothetical protein